MNEAEVQHFLELNLKDILDACTGFQGHYTSKPNFGLSCGIAADLGVVDSAGRIVALFECKGSIGINELVRGIGQVYQYQNHIDRRILYSYNPNAKAFLIMPIDTYQRYEVEKLAFPTKSDIILIDQKNTTFFPVARKKISSGKLGNVAIVSPYFIRDNRLGEVYLGLKMIEALSPRTRRGKVTMLKVRIELKKLIKNKGNERNIPISLHGLGFLDLENRLTAEGQRHLRMDYHEFCQNMAHNQIMPFLSLIMLALAKIASKKKQLLSKIITNPQEIRKVIKSLFDGSDVLYLTDSKTRYISSWLHIMRDDLGAISFKSGRYSDGLKINYFPIKGYPFMLEDMPLAPNCRDEDYIIKGLDAIAKL